MEDRSCRETGICTNCGRIDYYDYGSQEPDSEEMRWFTIGTWRVAGMLIALWTMVIVLFLIDGALYKIFGELHRIEDTLKSLKAQNLLSMQPEREPKKPRRD